MHSNLATRLTKQIALSLLDKVAGGQISPARAGAVSRHVLKLMPAHLGDREVIRILPVLGMWSFRNCQKSSPDLK